MAKTFKTIYTRELNCVETDCFADAYPMINDYINTHCEWQDSRDGRVRELLDFRTKLIHPYRRCVGGYNRNINIFFLLVEAMWIATGRKDVKTLVNFNSNMARFSDDGKVFHAPYGFRLRHWGIRSEDNLMECIERTAGTDQILNALRIFTENQNTRQVVLQIWNPDFDLGCKTKDIPCNDTVMMKIRNGKLITTIQNRSNDLHLGLPTNIFQFSFLAELMAACLGISMGTQTHNSQSLHLYEWEPSGKRMQQAYEELGDGFNLYAYASPRVMDFDFTTTEPAIRYQELCGYLNLILDTLNRKADGYETEADIVPTIFNFSKYFASVYLLLDGYLKYKKELKACNSDAAKDTLRRMSAGLVAAGNRDKELWWDYEVLAANYYLQRLTDKSKLKNHIGTL